MGTFDEPIGSLLIGSWISSLLEVLIIKGTIQYFINYPNDPLWKKALIGVTFVVDFVSLIAAYATVYLATVTFWGNTLAIINQPWTIPLAVMSTGTVAFLVQCFLIHRIWVLSRAKNWVFVILLSMNALVAFGCVLASASVIIKYPRYDQRHRGIIPITLWLSTTTAVDIGITAVLIFWFARMKTSFKHTENAIQKLIRVSLQTGSTTCAVAIATMITFIINPASNVEGLLTFVLCRVYVLTLLYNVNIRSTSSHGNDVQDSERYTANIVPSAVVLSEIQVHRTAHVHIDEDSPDIKTTVMLNNSPSKTGVDVYSDRDSVSKV